MEWPRHRAFQSSRLYDQAIADFSEVIKFDPNAAYASTNSGDTYLQIGDLDKAFVNYDRRSKRMQIIT